MRYLCYPIKHETDSKGRCSLRNESEGQLSIPLGHYNECGRGPPPAQAEAMQTVGMVEW